MVSFCKGEGKCADPPTAEGAQAEVEAPTAPLENAKAAAEDEKVAGSKFRDILKSTDEAQIKNIRALLKKQNKNSGEFLHSWDRLVRAHEHFKGLHLAKHLGDIEWNRTAWRELIQSPVLDSTVSEAGRIPRLVENTGKASLDLELGERPASVASDKKEPVKSLLVKSIKDDGDYPDPAPGAEVKDLGYASENELVVRYAQSCGVDPAKIGRLVPGTNVELPGKQQGIEGFLNETPISVKDMTKTRFANIASTLAENQSKIAGTEFRNVVIVVRTRSLTKADWLEDKDAAAIATNILILDGTIVSKISVLTSDGQWMWATAKETKWDENVGCGPL